MIFDVRLFYLKVGIHPNCYSFFRPLNKIIYIYSTCCIRIRLETFLHKMLGPVLGIQLQLYTNHCKLSIAVLIRIYHKTEYLYRYIKYNNIYLTYYAICFDKYTPHDSIGKLSVFYTYNNVCNKIIIIHPTHRYLYIKHRSI